MILIRNCNSLCDVIEICEHNEHNRPLFSSRNPVIVLLSCSRCGNLYSTGDTLRSVIIFKWEFICLSQEPSLFAVAKLLETGLVNLPRVEVLWKPVTAHLLEVCEIYDKLRLLVAINYMRKYNCLSTSFPLCLLGDEYLLVLV